MPLPVKSQRMTSPASGRPARTHVQFLASLNLVQHAVGAKPPRLVSAHPSELALLNLPREPTFDRCIICHQRIERVGARSQQNPSLGASSSYNFINISE